MISSKENILSCMKKHVLDELNNHYNATKRPDIFMLIGINYDVFAADMYYHKVATTDLDINIKRNPLSLLSVKLLFYTPSFVKLN